MNTSMKTVVLVIFLVSILSAQTVKQPAASSTGGGGPAAGPTLTMRSAAALPGINSASGGGGSIAMSAGFAPLAGILTGIDAIATLQVEEGWNLVSVPVLASDLRTIALFPASSSKAYAYVNGYQPRDTLAVGSGYWLKFGAGSTLEFQGVSVARETVLVGRGWNLVGGLSYPVAVADILELPPASVTSAYFGHSVSAGYSGIDTLEPGRGYWVKLQTGGGLVFKPAPGIEPGQPPSAAASRPDVSPSGERPFSTLELTDARGKTRTLHFTSVLSAADLAAFEMPPVPPAGTMDVRYATGRQVESATETGGNEVPLAVSSAVYPLSLRWMNAGGDEAVLSIGGKETSLAGEGSVVIGKPGQDLRIRLAGSPDDPLPREFTLEQNYPNPFNPATTIRYALPNAGRVALKLFNLLGQEVGTLVDEFQDAGYRSVKLDAGGLPSGVYFYRLTAGSETRCRKMVLLK